MSNFFSNLWNKVKTGASNAYHWFTGGVSSVANTVGTKVGHLYDDVKSGAGKVVDIAGGVINKVVDTGTGVVKGYTGFFQNIGYGGIAIVAILAFGIAKSIGSSNVEQIGTGVSHVVKSVKG